MPLSDDAAQACDAPHSRGGQPAPWHARPVDEILASLSVTPAGLAATEVTRRLAAFGANRLPRAQRRGPVVRLLLQFHNLLIYVLLVAAVLAAALDHGVDALVILAVVLLNAVIGFIQEGRAERALEAIRGMIDPRASVIRDGRRQTIQADQVVPGDIVLIEAGDRIPADLRLVRVRNLRIDESALTGESVPVDKSVDPVTPDAPLGDRTCMAWSGTFVAAGQGSGVVVTTGAATELGRISALISEVETLKTPLIRQMDGLASRLTVIILVLSLAVFVFASSVQGYAPGDALMIVIGLAVAAIPEGLPAVMTITLAIGVQRMAARNAIIRRLPAVETLGSVSVICSDKTGTLTRNEMTVRALVTADAVWAVSGVGYQPDGAVEPVGEAVPRDGDVRVMAELVRAGLLCNDAALHRDAQHWRIEGDPMEGALLTLAVKAGMDPADVRRQIPRDDEIPFDSASRFMATLHHSHDDGAFILVKGAPERIVAMCRAERGAAGDCPLRADHWQRAAEQLAVQGQRVLGIAVRPLATGRHELSHASLDGHVVMLGLCGFIDPPRSEAIAAVADCRSAGIRVIMITGDHAVTAREIARQLGLAADPGVMAGSELDALDAAGLRRVVRDTCVFARTTPEHKLRLVEALQAGGLTVAMTGDGVNDAPALKRADVGVAMGEKGTEAAKQAAEMVLADDNFASIVAAVREGRTVYDNLRKVIGWTLPTNGGEALTILTALAFGLALPITPAQILWINMVTAVALGLTLAFEPAEPGTMARRPRRGDQPLLDGALLWQVGFVSALFVIGAFGAYAWAGAQGLPLDHARTVVVNALVVMEIAYLINVRCVPGMSLRSLVHAPAVLVGVAVVFVAQLLFTYAPFMQRVFVTQALSPAGVLVVMAAGTGLFLCAEAEKWLRSRFVLSRAVRS